MFLRRFAGEKVTVVVILGVGVGGEGEETVFEGVVPEAEVLDLGAKKREITCCFCFPIAAA